MKKTLLTLLVALVAITSIFAFDSRQEVTGAPAGQYASTQVSFELKPSDITFFRFGFTSDEDTLRRLNVTKEPAPLESIDLVLSEDKTKASASKDLFLYYYFQGEKLPTITLSAGPGLSRPNYGSKIAYDVKITNTDITVSSGQAGKPITLKPLYNGVSAAYYPFSIETTTPITADMASNTYKTWSDTIRLTISQD